MPDNARSTDAAVQAQLDRLWALSPGADILGLGRVTELLRRLGDPQRRLPPVLHVAGTNGKGSTCAFLRSALEAQGYRVHAYTSPHLVRFNERIRLAGTLIDDATLAGLLAEVLDQADGIGASFFEVTTAAAFLAFARVPADACVIEVGLGGRLDATNVVTPVVTGIAQLGIDHQAFLGDTAEAIAGEKAGIAKPGVPLVTMRYAASVVARVAEVAAAAGAPVLAEGMAWRFATSGGRLRYGDAGGALEVPLPMLPGAHQAGNLALAIAMLRHQDMLPMNDAAFARAAERTRWPARMQRLAAGPLTASLPPGSELWLDGGHNEAAAAALAATVRGLADDRPLRLVVGMLANKDAAGLLDPLLPLADTVIAVPVPDHEHHTPLALAELARAGGVHRVGTAPDVAEALRQITALGEAGETAPRVLIIGSLYLAGDVLRANDELPD